MFPKARGLRNGVVSLLLTAFLLVLSVRLAWMAPPPQTAADGETVFRDKCAGCHTIGGGRLVGPDLSGVTARHDRAWLAHFIAEPDKMFASGDPSASALLQQFNNLRMPNLGLSPDQVTAVVDYLEAQGGAPLVPSAPPTAQGLARGHPIRGKHLFLGDVDLKNGGPPCMACHSAGRTGLLGGGAMGPNLTQVTARYGDAALAAALSTIPWPTMQPIFGEHPLTPEEGADLRAFFQAVSSEPQVNRGVLVVALALAGVAAALIAAGIVWRRRLRGVRRPLVERARSGH